MTDSTTNVSLYLHYHHISSVYTIKYEKYLNLYANCGTNSRSQHREVVYLRRVDRGDTLSSSSE